VATLTKEAARQMGVDEKLRAVVVETVEPGSIAEAAGLQPGDLVVSVDGQSVPDAKSFNDAVSKERLAKGVRLQLLRENVRRFAVLKSK
jgi:S1-C subfamily serine protease